MLSPAPCHISALASRRGKEELVLTGEGRNHTDTKKGHYRLPKSISISFCGLLQADEQDAAVQERAVYLPAAPSAFISFSHSLLGSGGAYLRWKVKLG